MRSKWAALLCLASVTLSPVLPAMAQEVFVPYEDAGTATYDGSAVYTGAAPVGNAGGYLFFRKDFDNAVGYDDGYSSVGWFQPFEILGANGFFGQGQVFVTDDGEVGGSLNAGWRTFVDSQNRVYGAYGGIDFDESTRGNRYEQVTLGIETLGQMWDFRLNGYFPLDNDSSFEGLRSLGGPPVFQGNNLVVLGTAFYEKPMPGADVEWGFPLLDPSGFGRLRSYFGGYVYDSEDKNPAGIRVRLESHVNEHVTLGAAFFHDDVNGGMATASLDIRGWSRSLPGLNNKTPSNEAKLYLPIVRNYRVAAETYVEDFSAAALDAGGNELDFVWVNNGNPGGGNGTFEDPFTDMPANAPGADYILVWQGPSSPANPVLGGITLEDGQRLYGEGFRFFIDVTGTKFGAMPGVFAIDDIVPTWGVNGQRPTLSNPGGNVITLANGNEVRSFDIVNSGGHGITGTGITDFDLRDLTFDGNAGAGIFLTNASGVGIIDNFAMLNNGGGGLRIQNTGVAPLTLTANGTTNPALQPNVVGGDIGLELFADGSDITATINDFFNTGSGTGAALTALNGANLDVEIDQGSFDNAQVGDGMTVTGDASNILLSLNDVTADGSVNGHGLNINLENTLFDGNVNSTVPGASSFSGNGLNGVNLVANNSPGANELHFLRAVVDNNGTLADPVDNDGLHIVLTNNTFFDVNFQNGSLQSNAGSAVYEEILSGSTLDILINPSNLSNSGEDGVRIIADASTIIHNIIDSTIDGSGQAGLVGAGNGIYATLTNAAVVEFNMTNTTVNQSNEHGLFIEASGASSFTTPVDALAVPALNGILSSAINDSNQSGGAFDGVHVVATGALTLVDLILRDTQADNTFAGGGLQQNALDFDIDLGAEFNFLAEDTLNPFNRDSSFSNSEEDGVLGLVQNGSIANVTFDGAPIDDSGASGAGSGMNLTVNTGSTLDVSVLNGSVSGSADNGILYDAQDPATIASLTVENSTIDDNVAGDGINLNVAADAQMTADVLDGSSVSNNGLGGIISAVDGAASTLDITITESTVDDNQGGDGVSVTATGASTSSLTVTDSTVDNNTAGNGINLDVTGDSTHTATLTNASASGSGLDGVRIVADGANTQVDLTADTMNADNNDEDGWDILVANGALFNGEMTDTTGDGNGGSVALGDGHGFLINVETDSEFNLDAFGGVSGSDNQLNGFFLTASGANTIARVNMTGANQFDDNGLEDPPGGYGVLVNASGIAELEAVVGGGSGNSLGGVEINADNIALITNVGVAGPSESNNNEGNGIFLNLQNNTDIQNVTITDADANGNTEEGILISLLNNVNPIQNVTVQTSTVSGNGQNGLSLIAENNDIDTILFDSLSVNNSQGLNASNGDGILVQLLSSNVTTSLTVSNSGSSENFQHGLNLDFDDSDVAALNITGNSLGGLGGLIGLDFLIVGPTNPIGGGGGGGNPTGVFAITNTSPTLDVTGFTFDVGPSNAGPNPVFDTLDSQFGFKFLPFGGSDVTTGLATINGTAVVPAIVDVPGTDNTTDAVATILVGGGVPNNTSILDLTFADFNPGETFQWDIDVDPAPNVDQGINGDDLVNSTITITFTGGLFLTGALEPAGPNSSTFVASGGNLAAPGFSANGGDGILISQRNGSDIGAMNISDNLMDGNDQHGLEFNVVDGTLPSPGNNSIISGNEITNQVNGDGIRLVNPNTNNTAIGMDITDNTISDNLAGAGINIQLNGDSTQAGTPSEFNYDGNTISGNGSFGSRFVAVDDAEYTLNYGQTPGADPNVFEGNGDAGIGIEVTDNTIGTINIANTTVSGTVDAANVNFNGDGLGIRTMMNSDVTLTIGDPLLANTSFNGNAGEGIDLFAIENSVLNSPTIQNVEANENNGHGVSIARRDNADFGVVTLDTVTASNNDADDNNVGSGLFVDTTNFSAPILQVDIFDSVFDENFIGASFTAGADSVLVVNATDTSFSGNESHGVNVVTNQTSTFGDFSASGGDPNGAGAIPSIFSSITASGNGGSGFNISLNDSSRGSVVIDDAGGTRSVIDGNAIDGIRWRSGGTTQGRLDVSATDITNENDVVTQDGINIAAEGTATLVANIDDVTIGSLIPSSIFPGMRGDGIDVSGSGNSDITLNVTNTNMYANDGDGYRGVHTGTSDFDGTFDNVDSRFNGTRGFDIFISSTDPDQDYNILNSMASDNGQQGIFWATRATTDGSATVSGPSPLAIPPNRNDFGSVNNVVATLNVIDSVITNNGQTNVANGDGLVLAVGSNTRTVATIAGNTFGGNVLDDVRIFPILSVNPANSTDDPDVGDLDTFVFDPTADLRLAFGIQDTNNDNVLDTVNINTGDQVEVTATGNGTTWTLADGSSSAGLFTNTDVFKGGSRSVNGDFDVIDSNAAPLFDLNDNLFEQFATPQDLVFEFITAGGFQGVAGPAFP